MEEDEEEGDLVALTTRRETQTTIETFLQMRGISCGLINGDSGARNQQTIARFKKSPPEIHVIVSTEAGSEGVNLQAANVLVNFDLPWNPMIVEQRIDSSATSQLLGASDKSRNWTASRHHPANPSWYRRKTFHIPEGD